MSWFEQELDHEQPFAEALRVQKAAAKLGFDWPDLAPLWDKLAEETLEFQEAVASADVDAIEDELGDMLFMLVNFSRFLKISPEAALNRSSQKFIHRLQHIEQRLKQTDQDWQQAGLEQLEAWWQEAKRI